MITVNDWAEDYPLLTKYAWFIDGVLQLDAPIEAVSGSQSLWRPSAIVVTGLMELLKVMVPKEESKPAMLTQANLKVVAGGWDVKTKGNDDPIVVDSEDESEKLFPDYRRAPLTQATLKGSCSKVVKWRYEGDCEEEHGEQTVMPAVDDIANRVEHDVLGGGWFIRRGNHAQLALDQVRQPGTSQPTLRHGWACSRISTRAHQRFRRRRRRTSVGEPGVDPAAAPTTREPRR